VQAPAVILRVLAARNTAPNIARKRAHAGAMADEITRAEIKGVTVYASGRLD